MTFVIKDNRKNQPRENQPRRLKTTYAVAEGFAVEVKDTSKAGEMFLSNGGCFYHANGSGDDLHT